MTIDAAKLNTVSLVSRLANMMVTCMTNLARQLDEQGKTSNQIGYDALVASLGTDAVIAMQGIHAQAKADVISAMTTFSQAAPTISDFVQAPTVTP